MNNDNTHSNHRGSSPPFQEPEQDFYRWLKGLKTIDLRDEMASATKSMPQPGNGKRAATDLMDASR